MILVYSLVLRNKSPLHFMESQTLTMDELGRAVSTQSSHLQTLAEAALGQDFFVTKILPSEGAPEWLEQLEDIGFIVGEPVTLMARAAFGGDPLVVRVGLSTFALRKAEAACVVISSIAPVFKAAA